MKTKLISVPILALIGCLFGCATTTTRSLSSSTDFEKVFAASKQAAVDCGFGVTSASAPDGFISAQQAVVMGHGTVVMLNIQVTRNGSGSSVQVSIVPPPGAAGNMEGYLDKFTKMLKNRVPDVAVAVSAQ